MPRPFTSRDIARDPRAMTPHFDRFRATVQEVILRSYTGSEQERADRAADMAAGRAPQEA